jgi:hypothetical protein
VQRELAHFSTAELIVRSRAALAELEPEHRAGAAGIPERAPDERRQATFDLVFQRASGVQRTIVPT